VRTVFWFSLSVLFSVFARQTLAGIEPRASEGELDLRQWDFTKQGALQLSGDWLFYMNQLIEPTEIKKAHGAHIDFPYTWNGVSDSHNSGIGYATYRLRVILTNHANPLSLELPHFYCNYKLWINEMVIAQNGVVATRAEQSKPQWLPQTVTFQPTSDTLDLVIHVSNFHHYKGGIREPIYLGKPETMKARRDSFVISNMVVCLGLLAIALAFTIIYFKHKKYPSLLYFAILCLSWGIRSVFSNNYLFISMFPEFPWELTVRIEYLTLYLTMIYAMLFLGKIFEGDVNLLIKYSLIGGNIIFVFTTLFFSVFFFTQLLPVYIFLCIVIIFYAFFIVLRALVYERKGVWLVIASLLLWLLIFGFDVLAYEGFIPFNPFIFHIGYLIIFSLNGLSLLYSSGFIFKSKKDESTLRFEDFFGSKLRD
jgi:7TM diverse intracellular signalling